MTIQFSNPVLIVSRDVVKDLDGDQALTGLWFLFNKCKGALNDGQRLENMSWRLWSRERVTLNSYRPLTPDSPTETSARSLGHSHVPVSICQPSQIASGSPRTPIGRVIYDMMPSSPLALSPALTAKFALCPRDLCSQCSPNNQPQQADLPTPAAEMVSISIVAPTTATNTQHRSGSTTATGSGTSSVTLASPPPLVVLVRPTPSPTPHPTPPATPILPPTVPAYEPPALRGEMSSEKRHLMPPTPLTSGPSTLTPPSPSSSSSTSPSTSTRGGEATLRPSDARKFFLPQARNGISPQSDSSSSARDPSPGSGSESESESEPTTHSRPKKKHRSRSRGRADRPLLLMTGKRRKGLLGPLNGKVKSAAAHKRGPSDEVVLPQPALAQPEKINGKLPEPERRTPVDQDNHQQPSLTPHAVQQLPNGRATKVLPDRPPPGPVQPKLALSKSRPTFNIGSNSSNGDGSRSKSSDDTSVSPVPKLPDSKTSSNTLGPPPARTHSRGGLSMMAMQLQMTSTDAPPPQVKDREGPLPQPPPAATTSKPPVLPPTDTVAGLAAATAFVQQQQQQKGQRVTVMVTDSETDWTSADEDEDDEEESNEARPVSSPPKKPAAPARQHPNKPPPPNLNEAALEAQRQRELFEKVPKRSYSNNLNLYRTRSGLLSQLMNPDPDIFPVNHPYRRGYSSGDVGPGVVRLGLNRNMRGLTPLPPPPASPAVAPIVNAAQPPPPRSRAGPSRSGSTASLKGGGFVPGKSVVAGPVAASVTAGSVDSPMPQHSPPVLPAQTRMPTLRRHHTDNGIFPGQSNPQAKGKGKEIAGNSGGYRPKGRPQEQEMEDTTDEEGGDDLQISKSVAQQKLAALASRKGIAPSKKEDAKMDDDSDLPPWVVDQIRGQEQRKPTPTTPIPLMYPYNLPQYAEPSTPRTTKQLMLRTEMSESLRQNLLWQRHQNRADIVGPRRRSSGALAGIKPMTPIPNVVQLRPKGETEQQGQQRQQQQQTTSRIARNKSWAADDYHTSGW